MSMNNEGNTSTGIPWLHIADKGRCTFGPLPNCSRSEAWNKCREAGRALGIPEHSWRRWRNQSGGGVGYYTEWPGVQERLAARDEERWLASPRPSDYLTTRRK